jgi:hypothetical protein
MKGLDRTYLEDEYVRNWLKGLSDRIEENYSKEFKRWLNFCKMSPSEQIQIRVKNLTSQDLSERLYFENRFRGFKESLEKTGIYFFCFNFEGKKAAEKSHAITDYSDYLNRWDLIEKALR